MSNYRTVRSTVRLWNSVYYIAERTLGFECADLGVGRGATLGIWVLPLTFCRTLDNFINPSGPQFLLLVERITYLCSTCPPHLEMVRGFIRWNGMYRDGQFCAPGGQEKCGGFRS